MPDEKLHLSAFGEGEESISVRAETERDATRRMLDELARRLGAETGVAEESLEHLSRPLEAPCVIELLRQRLDEVEDEPHE